MSRSWRCASGAFLDSVTQFGGDPFAKRLMWFGSATTPLTFVLTADLAGDLAAAVDVDVAPGERIEIGWDHPVGLQEIAGISSRLLRQQIKVRSIPDPVIRTAGRALGAFVPMVKDMAAMIDWFGTGRYVADTTRQGEVFGAGPTAEDAVARFAISLGHAVGA